MSTRLIEILENLSKSKVVLIGDLMVDQYLHGDAERLSPEAPVPVLHFQHEEARLGGAGSVAADLAVLGSEVRCVGVIGNDDTGKQLRKLLIDAHIDPNRLVEDSTRPTTKKLRLVGSAQHRHPQQLLRLDVENTEPVNSQVADQLVKRAIEGMNGASCVAIEDYNKGGVPPAVISQVIAAARQRQLPVIVDPAAVGDGQRYAGATAIKLNRPEAERATQMKLDRPERHREVAEKILKMLDLEAVILTLDKEGAYLATKQGEHRLLQTRARQVFDVTGAGDMMLAMIAAARGAGASWPEAVALANVAAGLEVERFGSVPVAPAEILEELLTEVRQTLGKQRKLEDLLPELARHRASGKKIVFTNGCFDLIHLGHVKYFRFAKEQGDLLVVGVNTDAGIRRLKGPKRPIISQSDRVGVLEELESIDYIVLFDQDTPIELVTAICPNVLVKGADYAAENVVGWDVVKAHGGKLALAPLVDGRSTSTLIQKILEAYREPESRT